MLESIGINLPVGADEWTAVEREHGARWPDKQMTKTIYRTKIQTGNPTCPPTVLTAKQIQEEIKRKTEMSEGESEKEDEGGGGDDDNDNDDDEIDPSDVSSPSARAVLGVEVLADPVADTGLTTVFDGTPIASAGPALNATAGPAERVSRPVRTKKKRRNGTVLNQLVTKRAKKNYGDGGDDEFDMNSYFKMMMVERQNERKEEIEHLLNERKEEKERRLDELEH